MSDNTIEVEVVLPRPFRYRLPGEQAATEYKAGRQSVPPLFAGNLIKAELLSIENFPGGAKDYQAAASAAGISIAAWDDVDAGLPIDFPGRDELIAAGIDTMAAVTSLIADGDLVDVRGIGPKTAAAIQAYE